MTSPVTGSTVSATWDGVKWEPVRVLAHRGGWPALTVEPRMATEKLPALGGADATQVMLVEWTPATDGAPRKRWLYVAHRGKTWR